MIRVRLKEAIGGKVYFLGKRDKSYGLARAMLRSLELQEEVLRALVQTVKVTQIN